MTKLSMIAIDPTDQDDAINALGLVEDLNGLIEDGKIEVRLNDKGEPTLYPVN